MTTLKRFLIFIFTILLGGFYASAQEFISPLSSYPTLLKYNNLQEKSTTKGSSAIFLKLPFIDDFSYNRLSPDDRLWSNKYVFINKSFGVNPVTIGVATFDAVNDTGGIYSYASSFPFIADSLTSNYVRLDSTIGSLNQLLSPADSIYLSFYFQPQGIGNPPEKEDSLILQFFNPLANLWTNIWQHEGMSLDSFRNMYGVDFKMVSIPIVNPAYFSKYFRFRFLNKVSIPNNTIPSWRSGLYDHWNLDYVYLNKDRNYGDNSISDLAFMESKNTLLKNYVSMPWEQYKVAAAAEIDNTISVKFRNMDLSPTVKNVNQFFSIEDLYDKSFYKATPYPSSFNMTSGMQVNYLPSYGGYTFQSSSPKYADFEVMYRVLTNTPPAESIRTNDTMRFYQRFYNYYAYDDGIPEAGYGLSNASARLAYKFTLNKGDSLQAIEMYFNQTLGNSSQQYFYLTVWDDNNGQPGNVIYEKAGKRPEYQSDLFKYYTYKLDKGIYLTGTFYVGWRQNTYDNMNLGFDMNKDNHNKIFYNSTGTWLNSSFAGTLMIRPILGSEKVAYTGIVSSKQNLADLIIYPNPCSTSILNIEIQNLSQSEKLKLNTQIYNINGQLIYSEQYSPIIRTDNLKKGIYLVKISSDDLRINKSKKLIIQ
ncbi:MAG: hypothetical protein AUJ98_00715 [Bacteroidetes bacterium CG2_30_33_31]|nr:MAG: hypothetical protein AUJ98_00715 [Bacteroidetes bacterium CG2_30_33_31]